MRRADAPSFQPAEAGGSKEKARIGAAPERATNNGPWWALLAPFAPVAQWIERRFRSPEMPVRFWLGAFVQWVPECVNTQEPVTTARLRGSDCTDKGNLSIPLSMGSIQGAVVNELRLDKQIQVLSLLVEGVSIRSIERITGVHRDTCVRLLGRVGAACQRLLDEKLTNLKIEALECDELWGYVGKKQKNVKPGENQRELGDQYIFIALDAKSKLVCAHRVGKRSTENTHLFMRDLQFRIVGRPTITTDGFAPYVQAVEQSFRANVDFAQLVKVYSGDEKTRERYSPSDFVRSFPATITGNPKRISTSLVERQNLTARMQVRRLTRLTNGFSKRPASLKAAMALHFAHYNFMRVHSTLRCTPAMECGLSDHIWTWNELLGTN